MEITRLWALRVPDHAGKPFKARDELALAAANVGWPSHIIARELLCLSEDLHKKVGQYMLKGKLDRRE